MEPLLRVVRAANRNVRNSQQWQAITQGQHVGHLVLVSLLATAGCLPASILWYR